MPKKYFILFLIAFCLALGALLNQQAARASGNLDITFQNTPLFSQEDFLPGDRVSRWVKIVNNAAQSLAIGVQAVNFVDPHGLGGKLIITIEQDGLELYRNSLAGLAAAGEIPLTNAPAAASLQYDLSIDFDQYAPNADQGRVLSFDLIFGSLTEDGSAHTISGPSSLPADFRPSRMGTEPTEGGSLLSIQAGSDQAALAGLTGSFQVAVSNIGGQTATNVILDQVLPAGLRFSGTGQGRKLTSLGDIPPGGFRSVSDLVDVPDDLSAGVYESRISARTDGQDGQDAVTAAALLAVAEPTIWERGIFSVWPGRNFLSAFFSSLSGAFSAVFDYLFP